MKTLLNLLFLIAGCFLVPENVNARARSSFGSKTYTKKAAYSGFGKKSSANGQFKVKSTSGHYKRTSKGSAYVNPYYRS